jgi:phosphopentomutase
VGEAPDAAAYGDAGSDTLGHVAEWAARHDAGWALPNLAAAGLGHLAALAGVPAHPAPTGAWGTMRPASAGKDSTTGHWEIAGVRLARPFPTYPRGFPPELVAAFAERTGRPVIGNTAASGTAVLDTYGPEHQRTGAWILYTSADSVFQVAAHEDVVPLAELYAACETARALLVAPHDVSRVIARPFVGSAGAYRRTGNRRDYSVAPPAETLLDALAAAGVPRAGVGKVDDLFAGRALSARHTAGNAEGIAGVEAWLRGDADGLLFANLVDFDTLFGHRNDPAGFAAALRAFDAALPAIAARCARTTCSSSPPTTGTTRPPRPTDHARERVPAAGVPVRASAPARSAKRGDPRGPRRDGGRVAGGRLPRRGVVVPRTRSAPRGARAVPRPAAPGRRPTPGLAECIAARGRRATAYAPYSQFRGGARCSRPTARSCRVQRRERVVPAGSAPSAAPCAARGGGRREFELLVLATDADVPTPPCGMCRQVLVEFAPTIHVVSVPATARCTDWSLGRPAAAPVRPRLAPPG